MMEIWYYTSNRKQMGPVSHDELRQLAGRGLLQPTDLVWKDGMRDWARASAMGLLGDENPTVSAPEAEHGARPVEDNREHPTGRFDARADDDEPEDDHPRGRRVRRPAEGMPVGVKIGLIVGGVIVLLIVAGVTLFFLLRPSGAIGIAAGRGHFPGFLGANDPRDPKMGGPSRVYNVRMTQGRTYVIDLQSNQFDSFLRLEDSALRELAQDDDSGGGLNARIIFRCPRSDNYRVIATSLHQGQGAYTLSIRDN